MANVPVNQFWKYCLQVFLLIANVVVLLFGLSVLAVGLWALLSEQHYYVISDGDPELTRLPISLVVVGTFVSLLSAMGVLGGILVRNFCGRILLGMYAFVLAFVIVSELGGAGAAIRFRNEIREKFIQSATDSLMLFNANGTNTSKVWNAFQRNQECCGSENYTSYRYVFRSNEVPSSCCNMTKISETNCNTIRLNVTGDADEYIYSRGCPDAVLDVLRENLVTIAVTIIVMSVAQVLGVVVPCVVIYVNSRLGKSTKSYAYEKLRRQIET